MYIGETFKHIQTMLADIIVKLQTKPQDNNEKAKLGKVL